MMDSFWAGIDSQLEQLATATTAAEVFAICPPAAGTSAPNAKGFFAGGGGDNLPHTPLREAGWKTVKWEAVYYWTMQAPNGDRISYVEGDLYEGDA